MYIIRLSGGISSCVSVYIIKGAPPLYLITRQRASFPRRPSPSPSAAPPPLPKGEADVNRSIGKTRWLPLGGELGRYATERGIPSPRPARCISSAYRAVYHHDTVVYIIKGAPPLLLITPPRASPPSAAPPSHPCHKKAKFPMFSAKTPLTSGKNRDILKVPTENGGMAPPYGKNFSKNLKKV